MIRSLAKRLEPVAKREERETIRILVSQDRALHRFWGHSQKDLILGSITAIVLYLSLRGHPALYALLGGLTALAVWRQWQLHRWDAIELIFSDKEVVAFSEGIKLWSIRYDEMRRICFQKGNQWLILVAADRGHILEKPAGFTSDRIYRAVGMIRRANPDVLLDFGYLRPLDGQDAWEYDEGYALSPVEMAVGKTYRYRHPESFPRRPFADFGGRLISLFPLFMLTFDMPRMWVVAGPLLLWALAALPGEWVRYQLHLSRHDRFRRTTEGLEISRGNRTWVVRDGRPFKLKSWRPNLGGNILRFERRGSPYYFDPRLIVEED